MCITVYLYHSIHHFCIVLDWNIQQDLLGMAPFCICAIGDGDGHGHFATDNSRWRNIFVLGLWPNLFWFGNWGLIGRWSMWELSEFTLITLCAEWWPLATRLKKYFGNRWTWERIAIKPSGIPGVLVQTRDKLEDEAAPDLTPLKGGTTGIMVIDQNFWKSSHRVDKHIVRSCKISKCFVSYLHHLCIKFGVAFLRKLGSNVLSRWGFAWQFPSIRRALKKNTINALSTQWISMPCQIMQDNSFRYAEAQLSATYRHTMAYRHSDLLLCCTCSIWSEYARIPSKLRSL